MVYKMIFSPKQMWFGTFYIENASITFPAKKPRTVYSISSKGERFLEPGNYFEVLLDPVRMGVWCTK